MQVLVSVQFNGWMIKVAGAGKGNSTKFILSVVKEIVGATLDKSRSKISRSEP